MKAGSDGRGGTSRQRPAGQRPSGPRVTVDNYREDPLHPRILRVAERLLMQGRVVTPVDVVQGMDLVTAREIRDWRDGCVPYLERVVRGSLTRLSRLLRILRFIAHDLNLAPERGRHVRQDPGGRGRPLRFTKTGDRRLEEAWSTHFRWPGRGPWRRRASRDRSD